MREHPELTPLMQNCKNCLENKWNYKFIDGWIRATCELCGYEVEFKVKERSKKELKNWRGAVAEYKIRKGKRFLKINGKWQEVELVQNQNYWKVTPVENKLNF